LIRCRKACGWHINSKDSLLQTPLHVQVHHTAIRTRDGRSQILGIRNPLRAYRPNPITAHDARFGRWTIDDNAADNWSVIF
jgi:hypothetical protein